MRRTMRHDPKPWRTPELLGTMSRPLALAALVAAISLPISATPLWSQPPQRPPAAQRGPGMPRPQGMQGGPRDFGRQPNPIEAQIFPPDLVMAHQREIGLSADQRQKIIAGVQQLEADLVPLRFEMSETTQRLAELLAAPKVDEEQALALVDRVTELEGQIKKRHLTLVIRTKNLLSAEQQSQLREIRRSGGY